MPARGSHSRYSTPCKLPFRGDFAPLGPSLSWADEPDRSAFPKRDPSRGLRAGARRASRSASAIVVLALGPIPRGRSTPLLSPAPLPGCSQRRSVEPKVLSRVTGPAGLRRPWPVACSWVHGRPAPSCHHGRTGRAYPLSRKQAQATRLAFGQQLVILLLLAPAIAGRFSASCSPGPRPRRPTA